MTKAAPGPPSLVDDAKAPAPIRRRSLGESSDRGKARAPLCPGRVASARPIVAGRKRHARRLRALKTDISAPFLYEKSSAGQGSAQGDSVYNGVKILTCIIDRHVAALLPAERAKNRVRNRSFAPLRGHQAKERQ